MNASEFTEPFDLERWAAGEPVYSMISERFLHFSHIEGVFYMAKEGGVNIKAGTQPTNWRMKPKASDDGWIPVVDGKCPIDQTDNRRYEARLKSGEMLRVFTDDISSKEVWLPIHGDASVAAVRLIKSNEKAEKAVEEVSKKIFQQPAPPQNNSDDAYLRFRQSPRGKDALAKIGKGEAPSYRALTDEGINSIAAAALVEHDKVWPRKI